MLEPNFTLPDKDVSKTETKRRSELIGWFSKRIYDAVVGLFVSGSMGYGYDYSVKESSDIDMQLVVTPETASKLKSMGIFDPNELEWALRGYQQNIYGQFSLVFPKDGVNMECHFWDRSAFIDAVSYQASETRRLRSGTETPSTDYGYTFARGENVKDYYGERVGPYAVGAFPSYREENGMLYLCRPITNILGLPRIVKTNPVLDAAIDTAWDKTVKRLAAFAQDDMIDLSKYNIENTLPGKNKMRKDILEAIRQKTKEKLKVLGVAFTD